MIIIVKNNDNIYQNYFYYKKMKVQKEQMNYYLSSENQELLKTILDNNPKSLKELEELTGRAKLNLSRT